MSLTNFMRNLTKVLANFKFITLLYGDQKCLLRWSGGLSGTGGREEISKALATHSEVEVKIARESEVLTSWDRVQICIELLEGSGAFGKLKSPSDRGLYYFQKLSFL